MEFWLWDQVTSRPAGLAIAAKTTSDDAISERLDLTRVWHLPIAPVAQWIEHRIPNPGAAGSIPAGGTTMKSLSIVAAKG